MSKARLGGLRALRVSAALLALGTLSLGGCERQAEAPPESTSRDAASPPAPAEQDKALLRAIQAPQDKARAVEADLMDAKRRDDAAIEEQGG